MTIRTGVVAAAVLLAGCGKGTPASAEQGQAAQVSATKLDVAGVRPGMLAADVEATLKRAGWTLEIFPGRDWAAEVAFENSRQTNHLAPQQPPRGVETIRANKGDEEIVVELRAVPTGSIVKLVRYEAPLAGRTAGQIRAEMPRRYGAPSVSEPGQLADMTWCTGGERCRNSYGAANPTLHVSTDAYNKLHITMSEGVAAERAWRAKLAAAAGGATPAKSSF